MRVYPRRILAGAVANRDFFTVYGPGNYWVLAGVFKMAGPTVLAERVVGMAYHVGLATGVFALTRGFGGSIACAAGIACALIPLPLGLGAYAWLGALALVVWSVALLAGGRPELPRLPACWAAWPWHGGSRWWWFSFRQACCCFGGAQRFADGSLSLPGATRLSTVWLS